MPHLVPVRATCFPLSLSLGPLVDRNQRAPRRTAPRRLAPAPLALLAFFSFLSALPLTGQRSGFPEGQARITKLLVQCCDNDPAGLYEVFRDLAKGLGPDVDFVVAIDPSVREDQARSLLESVGVLPHRITVVQPRLAGVTPWARDRLVVARESGRPKYIAPSRASVANDRRGDAAVANILAWDLPGGGDATTSDLAFEGGNLLITSGLAIASREFFVQNLELGVDAPRVHELVRELFGVRLLPVGRPGTFPNDHVDMYLTLIGPREILVGDPELGAALLSEHWHLRPFGELPSWDSWSLNTQARVAPALNDIADELRAAGFTVHRLPLLVGDGGGFLTWNNALVEKRGGLRRAFVPEYGIPSFDSVVRDRYEELGIEFIPVDVQQVAGLGGAVRCLTNVLAWELPRVREVRANSLDLESLPRLGALILGD